MSASPIIEVNGMHKDFWAWEDRPTKIKEILAEAARGRLGRWKRELFHALTDINFTINKGEYVGILGKNGAGKSTLLRILAGVYKPTSGTVRVKGRVAPLIELGIGFEPELSGYDNIFMNATLLGLDQTEIKNRVDEIIRFADIGSFISKPLKTYSSGMALRLGFSVAAHVDAEILLLDEVFAVGDREFERKCRNRIHELHQKGATILLATHNTPIVRDLCSRAIVFARRQKIFDGAANQGCREYFRSIGINDLDWTQYGLPSEDEEPGNQHVAAQALSQKTPPEQIANA